MKWFVKCAAGVIAGILLSANVVAQAAPSPTEAFFKRPDIVSAELSPSGRQLALTSARGIARVGLMVLDLDTGKITRTVQYADGDVSQVRWVNDKRLIFSVVDQSDGSGQSNGEPGLFAVNPDGSGLRQLVRRQGRPLIDDNGRGDRLLDWSHRLLRVPKPRAGEVNEEVLIYSINETRVKIPLWINTRSGRTRAIDFEVPPHTINWLTDGRGELRVALTEHEGRRAAYWRAPGQQAWTLLFESGLFSAPFAPHSVDDAGQLFVVVPRGKEQNTVLARYDFERNAPEATALVETAGFSFSGTLLDEGGGPALGVQITTDGATTVWFHPAMKALQEQTDARLPGRINLINCRRCGEPNMLAMVWSYSDREPGQLWIHQAQPPAGEKAWRLVGRYRDDINPAQMAVMDFHRIRSRDGRDLPVWVTKPANDKGPLPAVVLVHGGPWVRGNTWGWRANGQFLASRGFVVIEPEFRGSTGYGYAHYRAGFKQWGQAMQDDVADALLWAQKQGLASDKACIAGGSYGGYSTLMGLVKHPELYRCGVAWVAVTDLDLYVRGNWAVTDNIPDVGRQYHLPDLVGDPVKHADMIAANSPVKQAAHIKAPVMLAFGEDDLRVPLAHGKRMRDALREAGNDPVWVSYPGEGHGFAALRNRVDFADRMAAFLTMHLK